MKGQSGSWLGTLSCFSRVPLSLEHLQCRSYCWKWQFSFRKWPSRNIHGGYLDNYCSKLAISWQLPYFSCLSWEFYVIPLWWTQDYKLVIFVSRKWVVSLQISYSEASPYPWMVGFVSVCMLTQASWSIPECCKMVKGFLSTVQEGVKAMLQKNTKGSLGKMAAQEE